MTHTYFASTLGVTPSVLFDEAIRDARNVHGGEYHEWKREYIHEYHTVVFDEEKTDKVTDVLAKVIVRKHG